uniref:ATP-dependent RNA helicase Ski2/MTR4 C-terminal domain-containing protein n=1 Tax=Salix viminalis TaxID=40686 RepID=A0A6N2KVL6_SALVM
MTDIFEGSIIRSSRRLDEFLNQVICEIFSLKHQLLSLCYFSPRTKLLRENSVYKILLRAAAQAVGEVSLESKFAAASESLR